MDFGDFGDIFSGLGGAGRAGGFSDFFESVFGGRRGARGSAGFTTRGQDVEAEIELTLEEGRRGVTRSLALQTIATCQSCGGSGAQQQRPCPTCHGAGVVDQPRTLDVNIPAGVRRSDSPAKAKPGVATRRRAICCCAYDCARTRCSPPLVRATCKSNCPSLHGRPRSGPR